MTCGATTRITATEEDLKGGHIITRAYGNALGDEYTDRIVYKHIEDWFDVEEEN